MSYPPAEESIGYGFWCNVHQRYGFGPTGEPIYASQQIFETLWVWQRANYVDVYVVEPLPGFNKLTKNWSVVTWDLGGLTTFACLTLICYIFIYTVPYEA